MSICRTEPFMARTWKLGLHRMSTSWDSRTAAAASTSHGCRRWACRSIAGGVMRAAADALAHICAHCTQNGMQGAVPQFLATSVHKVGIALQACGDTI